jgi:hypothetical protein
MGWKDSSNLQKNDSHARTGIAPHWLVAYSLDPALGFVEFEKVLPTIQAAELKYCATDLASRLTCVLGEVYWADVRNVAVRANQNPRPGGCHELCRVTAAQMIKEPAAIVEPGIGHSIAGMQASERDARGQGAGSVM